jgi:hypothetical protein
MDDENALYELARLKTAEKIDRSARAANEEREKL